MLAAPVLGRVTHVFTHFRLELAVVASDESSRRRLVAAARHSGRSGPSDTLPARRRNRFSNQEHACGLNLFSPGPESIARTRSAPTRRRLAELASRRTPVSSSGATGFQPSGRRPAGMASGDNPPTCSSGIQDGQPRFSATEQPHANARAAFDTIGTLAQDEAPLFAAALSLAWWHSRHRFCANCGSSTGDRTRRLVAALPELLRPAFPACRPGRDHARRA